MFSISKFLIFQMTLDGEMLYIKVAVLDDILNFIVKSSHLRLFMSKNIDYNISIY
jgi:hypothetical protein